MCKVSIKPIHSNLHTSYNNLIPLELFLTILSVYYYWIFYCSFFVCFLSFLRGSKTGGKQIKLIIINLI